MSCHKSSQVMSGGRGGVWPACGLGERIVCVVFLVYPVIDSHMYSVGRIEPLSSVSEIAVVGEGDVVHLAFLRNFVDGAEAVGG